MRLAEILPGVPAHTAEVSGPAATLAVPYILHIFGWLPGVVAVIGGLLAIVWYSLMITESKYVQRWLTRHAAARKERKIARLKAKVKLYEAQLDALGVLKAAEEAATQKVENAKIEAGRVVAETEKKIKGGGGDARSP